MCVKLRRCCCRCCSPWGWPLSTHTPLPRCSHPLHHLLLLLLLQEYKEVARSKAADTGITLIPNEANLFVWGAQLKVGWRGGCWLMDAVA